MSRTVTALALTAAATLAAPPLADAQSMQACGKRSDIIKHLSGEYQEKPVAIGLADDGSLIEILTTTDGSTWTLMFSRANGMSCLVATGKDWQSLPRVAEVGPPA